MLQTKILKRLVHAYMLLSRTERTGFIVLMLLLLLLLSVRLTLHLWVKPDTDPQREAALAAAWQAFREDQALIARKGEAEQAGAIPERETPAPALLFAFDPNTLDSAGFRKLGIREKTTRMLLNWRRKGKKFYKKEDLRPLYTLTAADYERLEPYIRIAGHPTAPTPRKYEREDFPATIELNGADSQSLVRLRGIGPALAHRIIRRRETLGGFFQHDQLLEIYRFNDTVMQLLRQRLTINPEKVIKIPVNKASAATLALHPYIGKAMADSIILLRNNLGPFRDIGLLRQVPLMNEEKYRKIAPYLTAE